MQITQRRRAQIRGDRFDFLIPEPENIRGVIHKEIFQRDLPLPGSSQVDTGMIPQKKRMRGKNRGIPRRQKYDERNRDRPQYLFQE
jgi:hypothetical protein